MKIIKTEETRGLEFGADSSSGTIITTNAIKVAVEFPGEGITMGNLTVYIGHYLVLTALYSDEWSTRTVITGVYVIEWSAKYGPKFRLTPLEQTPMDKEVQKELVDLITNFVETNEEDL